MRRVSNPLVGAKGEIGKRPATPRMRQKIWYMEKLLGIEHVDQALFRVKGGMLKASNYIDELQALLDSGGSKASAGSPVPSKSVETEEERLLKEIRLIKEQIRICKASMK